MSQRISSFVTVLAVGALVFSSAGPAVAQGGSIAGSYWAFLDLGALGAPRIEQLGIILDDNGSVLLVSEHEDDKESTGVGAWGHLPGGLIGMGVASFRYGGAMPVCDLVGETSPPDNCILKVGGVLGRDPDGGLSGIMYLTVENLAGSSVLEFAPLEFPITMEKLGLGDFPGALP
ncbi:MAG: hypothetical protein R3190_11820 [Thermoanaerobaculia bacterium]|nr:hypothetical protein [Thermoanaerobaculia bacterium]